MKTIIMALLITLGANATPKQLTVEQVIERLEDAGNLEFDAYEICTSKELVKKYKLQAECLQILKEIK